VNGYGFFGRLIALVVASVSVPAIHAATPVRSPGKSACAQQGLGTVASLTQAAARIVCAASDRDLLIVGELHGGNETPELVALLASDALRSRSVRLGLEIPSDEQAALNTYLHSSGGAEDQVKLLRGRFWTLRDGRSSKAMLLLIEHVRVLRERGNDVTLFAMEPVYSDPAAIARAGGVLSFKEMGMAQAIRQAMAGGGPHQLVIALMGNFHSRHGKDYPPSAAPGPSVTARLAAESPYVVLPLARQTAAWNCQSDGCGVHSYTSDDAPTGRLPRFVTDVDDVGGLTVIKLWLPTMTAALPEIGSASKATDSGSPSGNVPPSST
jgi:hypothetical protein